MKKIKYLFIASIALFLSVSCEDALDIVQDGELDDNATFETVTDLRKYLTGSVYSSLGATSEIMLSAVFTDEVGIGPLNGGQELDLHRFFLNKSTGYVAGIWGTHYTVINRVNRLLEASEKISVLPGEEATFKSIIAQAKALRAYSYMQLLIYFSTDMSNDEALGVMLLDYVPLADEKLPRVANGKIVELIEKDLEYAINNISTPESMNDFSFITTVNKYKFVSKNLINSIYARYYLYRKNYPLAKHYAQEVISTSGLTLTPSLPFANNDSFYSNTTNNPYRRIWADLAQGEVIFALSRPSGGDWGNIASNFFFNSTDVEGGAFLDMGRNLYNKLGEVPGDIRFNAFVDPTSRIDPTYMTNANYKFSDAIIIDKYPGKTGAVLRNDIKVFRLSEMYFILAECAVVDNQLTIAAGYIKNIRDARSRTGARPLPVYANQTAAWADIMDEKRKEFCYEGFRYLDIKRLGVLADRSVDRNETDDIIRNLPTTISNTDYRFISLPIPQAEISGNPTIQQNPGYIN